MLINLWPEYWEEYLKRMNKKVDEEIGEGGLKRMDNFGSFGSF